ncbi:MAG: ribosomal L7Ae/L30e/S12e/Gadd45 family protein [Clostridia bacterium]|nr:ribosomal L7Ae/L30e/S12e/Gadd45 family protein [Clostridia bacterium]
MLDDLPAAQRIVGTKQVIKAVQSGTAIKCVYVASDADESVRTKILSACRQNRVEAEVTSSMEELGDLCRIDVGAACVAVLE